MITTPIEQLASLRVGTVEYISPDRIEVQLDIESPDSVALNTGMPRSFPRINGYLMIPVDLGFVVGQVSWITIQRSPYPKRSGFQDFGLIEYETIDFNLDIGLKFSNLNVSDKRTAKYEALKKVNINKKLSTPIYTLSGGEKQRIACARVLLKNSKIILADEPTGSLDKRNKEQVVEILSQQASQGTLVIVVTHDPYLTKIGNKKIML